MKTKNMNKYRTVCRYGSNNQWNNRKKKGKHDTINTYIHHLSTSWLRTGTAIKSSGVKPVSRAPISPLTEMMSSCKCFPGISNKPLLK